MTKLLIPDGSVESWVCPHCDRPATIQAQDKFVKGENITNHDGGRATYEFVAYSCPNPGCRKLSANIKVADNIPRPDFQVGQQNAGHAIKLYNDKQKFNLDMTLVPFGAGKQLPEYVNEKVREDYEEACAIVSLSPKASATLLRRCLQTIIRDFWKIKPQRTLYDEIKLLADVDVDPVLKLFFDGIRNAGNFGAHLNDETLYVEMDQGEAKSIIESIEIIIDKTYILSYKNKEQADKMSKINEKFKSKKKKPSKKTSKSKSK